MTEPNRTDRRTFLRRGAVGATALWTISLEHMMARRAGAAPLESSPYGEIFPTADRSTGLPLLQLPKGFRYRSFSWTGDVMSDGIACPSLHDGMAVIDQWHDGRGDWDRWSDGHWDHDRSKRRGGRGRGKSGDIVLVRNHEQDSGAAYLDDPDITYVPQGAAQANGAAGTTNLVFDTKRGRWEHVWASLAGTVRNCAGGVTPWGSWVTCEETTVAGHGWTFEVDACSGDPTPLTAMGRFSHEAMMVDPRTGFVYETEDAGNSSGFYKFVPDRPGRLESGGKLYMLKVKNTPKAVLGTFYQTGTTWDVEWVLIDDPTAATKSVFNQGRDKDAASFSRLEGAWWADRVGYFLSTNGGSVGEGQVFEYNPRTEKLKLIYDSPAGAELDNPDNLTVTPNGSLLMCEDAAGNDFTEGERLIGLTLKGEAFTFAMNNINLTAEQIEKAGKTIAPGNYTQSEWAGACFSPDGRWLFVNIQSPGITFAITGPWHKGPL